MGAKRADKRKHQEESTVPGTPANDSARFKLVDKYELKRQSKPSIPANTLRKSLWAVKLYQEWVDYVLQHGDDDVVKQTLLNTSDLLTLSEHDSNLVLSSFVLSLKKRDGGDYTSGSLFSIIMAIQKHLEVNGRRVFSLTIHALHNSRTALITLCKQLPKKVLG